MAGPGHRIYGAICWAKLGWARLGFSGTAESTRAAITRGEIINDVQLHLGHRNNDQLRDAIHGLDRKSSFAAIPSGNLQGPLVIRIDQANQITQYDAVLMAQT